MRTVFERRVVLALLVMLLSTACSKQSAPPPDQPLLTPYVVLRDVTFRSAALKRDMPYRVVMPATVPPGRKLPVVYLLHGGGGGFHDWTNYSDVAKFAEHGLILVMPEGSYSYYTNAVDPPGDRYEDYIAHDVIADVESRFPVASGRANRAVVGMSMGGFGAVKLALDHPDLFVFAGGLSTAIDAPRRGFSLVRPQQSRHYNAIFGPAGSETRRAADPFIVAKSANPDAVPYMFLTCGEQEGLLAPNREFARLLESRHFHYEFHTMPGGHSWNQWDVWIPTLFNSLEAHMRFSPEAHKTLGASTPSN